jgi:hypothetical protein
VNASSSSANRFVHCYRVSALLRSDSTFKPSESLLHSNNDAGVQSNGMLLMKNGARYASLASNRAGWNGDAIAAALVSSEMKPAIA